MKEREPATPPLKGDFLTERFKKNLERSVAEKILTDLPVFEEMAFNIPYEFDIRDYKTEDEKNLDFDLKKCIGYLQERLLKKKYRIYNEDQLNIRIVKIEY